GIMTIQNENHPTKGMLRPRQVCDHCGGPFGMVTHRWWGNKFCKRRCKDAYLREIMPDRDTLYCWCGLLGAISRTRSLPDQNRSCVAPGECWPRWLERIGGNRRQPCMEMQHEEALH